MNVGRYGHASLAIKDKLFVFFGILHGENKMTASIEALSIKELDSGWN